MIFDGACQVRILESPSGEARNHDQNALPGNPREAGSATGNANSDAYPDGTQSDTRHGKPMRKHPSGGVHTKHAKADEHLAADPPPSAKEGVHPRDVPGAPPPKEGYLFREVPPLTFSRACRMLVTPSGCRAADRSSSLSRKTSGVAIHGRHVSAKGLHPTTRPAPRHTRRRAFQRREAQPPDEVHSTKAEALPGNAREARSTKGTQTATPNLMAPRATHATATPSANIRKAESTRRTRNGRAT